MGGRVRPVRSPGSTDSPFWGVVACGTLSCRSDCVYTEGMGKREVCWSSATLLGVLTSSGHTRGCADCVGCPASDSLSHVGLSVLLGWVICLMMLLCGFGRVVVGMGLLQA